MSNELPETISRRNLIALLRDSSDLTTTRVRAIRDKYGLTVDVPELVAAATTHKQVLEERNVLYRLYTESSTKVSTAEAELRALAEKVASTRVVEELKPGWIDQDFLDKFTDERVKRAVAKLNQTPTPELFQYNDRDLLLSAGRYLKDEAYDESVYVRVHNLLYPTYNGARHNGFHGQEYSLGLDNSQRLGDEACRAWRAGDIGYTFGVRDYTAIVRENHVEIGCQTISKDEITRVAALMGWGGFTKQEGPELYPSFLPIEVGKSYVSRDGQTVTVKVVPNVRDIVTVVDEKGTELGMVFTNTGRSNGEGGTDRDFDITAAYEESTPTELFPLQDGVEVVLRDGRKAVTAPSHSDNEIVRLVVDDKEICSKWRENGRTWKKGTDWGNRESNDDVVAFAPPPLFPLVNGMHVRLRDGREGWVFDSANGPTLARIRKANDELADRITTVSRATGKRYTGERESNQDVVAFFDAPVVEEAKAEEPKLILPLEVGQRVRLRNGEERTICAIGEGTRPTASYQRDDGTRQNSMVYASSGSGWIEPEGREHDNDVVETISHPFPLQVGDRVRYRNGNEAQVSSIDPGHRGVAWLDGKNHAVWVDNGKAGAETVNSPNDVVFILKRELETVAA